MTRTLASALAITIALAAPVSAPVSAQAPTAAAASAAENPAREALWQLFRDSDEATLKRNPIQALFRGDMRYADRLGDYITDAYYAAEREAGTSDLKRLEAIDRSKLDATDRIAYDVFKWQSQENLKGLTPEILALTAVRPLNHFSGIHTFYPSFASATGGAPFATVADYENNLKRHQEFVTFIDRAVGRFREGMASGVVETKLTINNVIDQLATQLAQPPEQSPFYTPVEKFPEGIAAADQTRLKAEYRAMIADKIYPAYKQLHDFLKAEYLPVARDQVGLSAMKGGPVLYAQLIETTTTLPLKAEDIHALGLSEVKRIHTEMEKVRAEVGFKGTLGEFFQHLRTDPKLQPESREWLTKRYFEIGKTVDAKVPDYFSTVPKSPLDIRPYEPFREKHEAGGSYMPGTPDGTRAGIFYFNAYDLPSRTTPGMTTLYLHEGAPGHHFQISLAQENEALPSFMRFGGNTAYVEGWALYSETLGFPMGFYEDPYQRFGTLSDEMLRAMRLVVDTGLHSKGWTRDQAIEYMLANSDMGKTDATAEVERYIAIPSQALAYKIGAMKIQELRAKAEKTLGPKFDIRDFHAQVLMTGALPLAVLETKIENWITAKK
ncbi:DUF885 domain-containing protein [Sphingosinicella soli]|uniref:Uncharacterized protein (DUF885 family) n=1 Tax=Sphingosinicella soli TaxID=333708 RepID=A0A7W7B064_9SPHN|nr:DUF885 domain-containing protein [Sphingosinicella soli]MBB4631584.1 uncharacterized protein (DUF885 family) [Sphingosinicella soli]